MIDWPCIATRFAYWGTLVGLILLLLFLYIRSAPPRSVGQINDGTATVNQIGTVTNWTNRAEAVTGIDRKKMIGNEVFYALPEPRRSEIRKCFERSLSDDKMYPWPTVSFLGPRGRVELTFRRQDDFRIEAVFTR